MICGKRIHSWTAGHLMLVTALLVVIGLFSSQPAWADSACLSASGEAAVMACRSALRNEPGNREIRLALSDAYLSLRRYEDAVAVLRDGFEHFPGDDTIKRQLSLAESYLEEQQWIEKRERSTKAAQSSASQSTQTRLNIIRCNKLNGEAAIAACNAGLAQSPDNPDLLTGRGKAWMAMDRFGNAIADFQAALAVASDNREAAKQLRLANTKRDIKVSQCLKGSGQKGLASCEAALLTSAADEFSVRKQQARLLHTMGRDKEALRAYRAAARLNPADAQVNRALAALSPPPRPTTASQSSKTVALAAPATKTTSATQKPRKTTPAPPKKAPAPIRPKGKPTAPAVSANPPKKAVKPAPVVAAAPPASISEGARTQPSKPKETAALVPTQAAPIPSPNATIVAKVDAPAPGNTRPPSSPATASPRPQQRYSNVPQIPGITH